MDSCFSSSNPSSCPLGSCRNSCLLLRSQLSSVSARGMPVMAASCDGTLSPRACARGCPNGYTIGYERLFRDPGGHSLVATVQPECGCPDGATDCADSERVNPDAHPPQYAVGTWRIVARPPSVDFGCSPPCSHNHSLACPPPACPPCREFSRLPVPVCDRHRLVHACQPPARTPPECIDGPPRRCLIFWVEPALRRYGGSIVPGLSFPGDVHVHWQGATVR